MKNHAEKTTMEDVRSSESKSTEAGEPTQRARFQVIPVQTATAAEDSGYECSGSSCSCGD